MKEALFYKKLKSNIVQCILCPRNCVIQNGATGFCKVRKNINGKLYSLAYGKPCAAHIDPIEKKPLYHFMPGTMSYSVGTVGCSLRCLFCQNWEISQSKPEEVLSFDLSPKKIIEEAVKNNCKSIAYTYTEPSIIAEYVLDTAKLAKKNGIKNIIVSNGFVNEKPLRELCKYIDGANIDLKGNDEFYRKICFGWIKPVLESLKNLKKNKIWLEITNLVIPGYNDNEKEIEKMCKWIVNNLSKDTPLHFSGFYPCYKLTNIKPTSEKTLINAKRIAEKTGLKYVYVGNIYIEKAENTYCPKCGKLLVERLNFDILQNNIKKGRCICGENIPGVW